MTLQEEAEIAYRKYYTHQRADMTMEKWVKAYMAGTKTIRYSSLGEAVAYQDQVGAWMKACFGDEILTDKLERNHRFLEEAIELVQACGMPVHESHLLVDYVYGRPVGEPKQEVGGVMVTLAALCNAHGISIMNCGADGLKEAWGRIAQIREKQKNKPKFGPLPGSSDASITSITFEEFVQYAKANGALCKNSIPWCFKYKGVDVTYEDDSTYLVGHARFKKGQILCSSKRDRSTLIWTRNWDAALDKFPKPPVPPLGVGSCGGDLESDYASPLTKAIYEVFEPKHPDDIAVDQIAVAMKARLRLKRTQGRGGWHDLKDCSAEKLSAMLMAAALKGKPVDVANFAMMLYCRDELIDHESICNVMAEIFEVNLAPKNVLVALQSANEVCRSALAIAIAEGGERVIRHNWPGFIKQTQESLKLQHAVMYPKGGEPVVEAAKHENVTLLGREVIDKALEHNAIAGILKYPEEWDTAAYPSLLSAISETHACANIQGIADLERLVGEALGKFHELQSVLKKV